MEREIVRITNTDAEFYRLMGPFLSRREIVRELNGPVWDEDGRVWWIALVNGSVAAFLGVKWLGDALEIGSCYTLPKYRKQGLMEALIRTLLERVNGPFKAVANNNSFPLFMKLGFVKTGMRGRYNLVRRGQREH